MTHTDLIERLEEATEGSRELSDMVLLASGWNKLTYDYNQLIVWGSPAGERFRYEDRPGLKKRPVPDRPNPTDDIADAFELIHDHMKRIGRSGYEIHLREVDGEWVFFEITIPSYEFQGRSHTSIPLAACQAWARIAEHDGALKARDME